LWRVRELAGRRFALLSPCGLRAIKVNDHTEVVVVDPPRNNESLRRFKRIVETGVLKST
jgi:hypothetical protein